MEKILQKIKNLSLITLVIAILSLTWLFLDYLALRKIWVQSPTGFNFEWLMVSISAIPFLLLDLLIFIILFYLFRLNRKFKFEKKKQEKIESENKNFPNNNITNN